MIKLVSNIPLTIEEVAQIERSLQVLRRIVQINNRVACREFTKCHPIMAQLLRDYITATIEQDNELLTAMANINRMYRFILSKAQKV